MKYQTKIAVTGLFGALSVVLGIMENFIPLPVPGLRIGLSNIAIMLVLYMYGRKYAFMVLLIKLALVPILSGNMLFRLSIGFPSGIAAFIAMVAVFTLFDKYITTVTTGVAGAFIHMLVQLFVINVLYINGIFTGKIAGWFLLTATVTGVITGVTAGIILDRLKKLKIAF